jgi:hypothetical protein
MPTLSRYDGQQSFSRKVKQAFLYQPYLAYNSGARTGAASWSGSGTNKMTWLRPTLLSTLSPHRRTHGRPNSGSMSPAMWAPIPECRTIRHPVSPVPDWKKLTMPEPGRYRNKATQSGIFLVRYRTEMTDAGIPMPALVFWMPMPTYADQEPRLLPAMNVYKYMLCVIVYEYMLCLFHHHSE